jgi:hypothetical protein
MTTSIPSNALAAAAAVKNALNDMRRHAATLQEEENSLVKQRKELQEMPLPLSDIKQVMLDYIDARGRLFLTDGNLQKSMREFVYPHNQGMARDSSNGRIIDKPLTYDQAEILRTGDISNKVFGDHTGHPLLFSGNQMALGITNAAYYFFLGDIIKAKIAEQFDEQAISHHTCDQGKIGPPIAERVKTIAR